MTNEVSLKEFTMVRRFESTNYALRDMMMSCRVILGKPATTLKHNAEKILVWE